MILTEKQSDALSELINIAFARTAASLSELSGHRVLLNAPGLEVLSIDELAASLKNFIPEEVISVHQIFNGPVAGDALLILNHQGAIRLADHHRQQHGRGGAEGRRRGTRTITE